MSLIDGTSTGAIIAAGLALGMSAKDITELALDGNDGAMRRRGRWRLNGTRKGARSGGESRGDRS